LQINSIPLCNNTAFEKRFLLDEQVAAASHQVSGQPVCVVRSDNVRFQQTLRIERAIENTKRFGLRVRPPKSARGLRSIKLDDATLTVLKSHVDLHHRIAAGIPDGAEADLSLIRLDGLIFLAWHAARSAERHQRVR
jgi:hypothetical protein